MAKTFFRPEALKGPYEDDPEWEELKEQYKWALALRVVITLDEYMNMGNFETSALQEAYNELHGED